MRVYGIGCGGADTAIIGDMLHLSRDAARHLQLAAQALAASPRRRATRNDVLATIRQMGVLQIDTIHIVARSPYLVLWSRLGRYDPEWLEQHLAEGTAV